MSLRGCSSLHYIFNIKDGVVEKVYNMDLHGRPSPKFKKLEEIYQHADAEYTPFLAERETNGYGVQENESSLEELTLSQFKKKLKRKKMKVSEPVLLTPKAEDDDFDLTEPLCKFRIKVSKSSRSKRVSANGNSLTSSEVSKEFGTFNIKVEVPEVEYFENNQDSKEKESESFPNEMEKCDSNEVSEVEYFEDNFDLKRGGLDSFTNEGENCEFNEVPDMVFFKSNHDLKSFSNEGEKCEVLVDSGDDIKNMEMDNGESIVNVNQPLSIANDSFLKDSSASASDYSESQLYFQLTSEQFTVQDSDPKIDDEHGRDVVSSEAKSPIFVENKKLTSMNIDADSKPSISDDNYLVSNVIFVPQEPLSIVLADTDSEVKLDHNDQTGVASEVSEIRQVERLPLTRKFISPNSQEKLCQAMKSADSLDDMEHFKCKEKLNFGDNTFSSTKADNELDAQFIQNKAVISMKHVLKRPRTYKKSSPTKKGIAPKGCLDGPRLCRSLPRISTGCTSIEGCSESAIAFSQRQMHDIESLASKLLSELNSMKVIVEEKLLYEACSSTSLKNEADEVKSAIKSATKTEETAKRWLSMMARDCNRFCKIMKLNEDHNTSASGDPALENQNQEKPLEREKKKISFADEAGGTLCDVKVYQIEQEPSVA